jgi:uncharacterized C2H2 Zn-finger protein
MNDNTANSKITVSCPAGHRLRGDIQMAGNTVRCPKCSVEFVFAPLKSDAAVNRAVTDTGVMRILGDSPELPPIPEKKMATDRPCPRCGILMSINASVCKHCNCYVGVMPRFMQDLLSKDSDAARNG